MFDMQGNALKEDGRRVAQPSGALGWWGKGRKNGLMGFVMEFLAIFNVCRCLLVIDVGFNTFWSSLVTAKEGPGAFSMNTMPLCARSEADLRHIPFRLEITESHVPTFPVMVAV